MTQTYKVKYESVVSKCESRCAGNFKFIFKTFLIAIKRGLTNNKLHFLTGENTIYVHAYVFIQKTEKLS